MEQAPLTEIIEVPEAEDYPALGKVVSAGEGKVVFCPSGTRYQMHLAMAAAYSGPMNSPIKARISVTARKVYTVPRGGNFVTPIFGTPKIIQGRIRHLSEKFMIVQAGTPVVVELPAEDSAIDLDEGPLAVGALVNVVAKPGAGFGLLVGGKGK